MNYQLIEFREKFDGQVGEIQLNSPPANILASKMMKEISSLLRTEEKNTKRKLIIFSGSGKHFSVGASVQEHTADKVKSMLPQFHRLIGQIIDFPIPTLAKVSGHCLGGGFELALSSTFLFADEEAQLGVPEIQLGLFPPVAACLLPLKSTAAWAGEMILTGKKFMAKELIHSGLVTRVVDANSLENSVSTFIEHYILPKSASSLKLAHKALNLYLSTNYKNMIGKLETLYLKDLMATPDAVEGIQAFLEKRPPKWI